MKRVLMSLVLCAAAVYGLAIPVTCEAATHNRWAIVLSTGDAETFLSATPENVESWTMFGDQTVFLGGDTLLEQLGKAGIKSREFPLRSEESAWLMATRDRQVSRDVLPGARIILRVQGFRVFLANETARMGLGSKQSDFTTITPLPVNTVVLSKPAQPGKKPRPDAISALLEKIDMAAFAADVKALADLKTRYTYGDGAVKALAYCEKVMKDLGLTTRRLPFGSTGTPRENLEGVQTGFDAGNAGEVIIIGHLDSTSPQASTLAPGADDNGSGAAGVLALARLMKGLNPRTTVRYVLVLGEEQGILGSKAYVAGLKPAELAKIRNVINMDMISFDKTPPLTMVIETGPYNQQMADEMTELAKKYTGAVSQISMNPWGSDHVPFIKKEIPCVLTIESEYDDNPTYHQITDTPEKMNLDLAREILKLNAAALAVYSSVDRSPRP